MSYESERFHVCLQLQTAGCTAVQIRSAQSILEGTKAQTKELACRPEPMSLALVLHRCIQISLRTSTQVLEQSVAAGCANAG